MTKTLDGDITDLPVKVGGYPELIFIDPEITGAVKRIFFREIVFQDMTVHEESVMARLKKAYQIIDEDYKAVNSVCKKGCSHCCTANFTISIQEFFSIVNSLGLGSPMILKYSAKARKIVKDTIFQSEDSKLLFTDCLFVDEKDRSCRIYHVRPSLCRLYGNVDKLTKCEKIQDYNDLCRLDEKLAELSVHDTDSLLYEGKIYGSPAKPIVYWFADMTEAGKMKTQRMNDLYTSFFSRPAGDFFKILLLE